MNRFWQSATQWCGKHKKLCFALLIITLLNMSCLIMRSSYVPTIRVHAIDVDTRQPIGDALVIVHYYTGIINETSEAQECRITDDSGVVEFPARMIWAHWWAPDVYTDAKIFFQHYYYVADAIHPSFVVRNQQYFANPTFVEVEGRHIDKLRDDWMNLLYTNLKMTFRRLPYYYEISNGPRETPKQILRHYEATFDNYKINGISTEMENIFRDKLSEYRRVEINK